MFLFLLFLGVGVAVAASSSKGGGGASSAPSTGDAHVDDYLNTLTAQVDQIASTIQQQQVDERKAAQAQVDGYRDELDKEFPEYKGYIDSAAWVINAAITVMDFARKTLSENPDSQAWADTAAGLAGDQLRRGFFPFLRLGDDFAKQYDLELLSKDMGEWGLARLDSEVTPEARDLINEFGRQTLATFGDPHVQALCKRLTENPFGELGTYPFYFPAYVPPRDGDAFGADPKNAWARDGRLFADTKTHGSADPSWWLREHVDPAVLAGYVAAAAYGKPEMAEAAVVAAVTAHQGFWAKYPPTKDQVPADYQLYPIALAWGAARALVRGDTAATPVVKANPAVPTVSKPTVERTF